MPTDVLVALERRKAERQSERSKVFYVPLALCVLTVALAVTSPSFAAAMMLLALD